MLQGDVSKDDHVNKSLWCIYFETLRTNHESTSNNHFLTSFICQNSDQIESSSRIKWCYWSELEA